MEPTTEELIQHAITEANAGNKETARKILSGVLKQTPQDARVWYLLSQVVETREQSVYCLERVLVLQPDNLQAKEKLGRMGAKENPPSRHTVEASSTIKPNKKANPWLWIVPGLMGLLALMCVCIIAISSTAITATPTEIAAMLPITQAPAELPGIPLPQTLTPTFTLESSATLAPTASPTLIYPTEPNSLQSTIQISPVPIGASTQNPPTSGESLRAYFFDVGQGDATLIQTPDGKNILIDGGETDTGIVQYLQSLGIQRIDLMIATHPHSDHIGGLVQVLQAMQVSKVVTNGQINPGSTYENLLDAISTAKAEYVEVKQGDRISAGGFNILVLNPISNTGTDINENSLVLQFIYGNTTFLMMGDAGNRTETDLMATGLPLKADILKVGHHGSDSSSSAEFLNVVKPAVAVYFAGLNNQFNLPAPQTISALQAVGAQVYGTDKNGTIVITVDGSGYKIQTGKNETRAQPIILPTEPQPAPVVGGLQIVSLTSPISPGAEATLNAKTVPGASCTITVYTKSGVSEAQGLESKTADSNGNVSWTWKVGTRTTAGNWKIVVTANVNGQSYTQETIFTVR